MSSYNELISGYKNLFGIGAEKDGEDAEERGKEIAKGKGFYDNWGWYITLDKVAKGDRSKWDYYLDMKITEFLNTLCYIKDKERDFIDTLDRAKTYEQKMYIINLYGTR